MAGGTEGMNPGSSAPGGFSAENFSALVFLVIVTLCGQTRITALTEIAVKTIIFHLPHLPISHPLGVLACVCV